MVAEAELVNTVGVANQLGEGVLWNATRRSVWWTDIESSMLFEYDPVSDTFATWDTPFRVACFGFVEDDTRLIVAFDRSIAYYDPNSGAIDWLIGPDTLPDGLRFNDGKIDPAGRFWVGTMIEDPGVASVKGALYCVDPEVGLVECIKDITISNGLCWSPDGSVMYHADSPGNTICSYQFDVVSGTVSGRQDFARTASGVQPDGSTVDSEGGLWNAQWGSGQVVRYSTSGRESLVLDVPASQPTCVAFGGENMDMLFITSATAGLSEEQLAGEPLAGSLFVVQTKFTGLPASRLRW